MKLKVFFLSLMYFSSIYTFYENVKAEDFQVNNESEFYYVSGRVQAYCQLHSVGQLSKKNTKIWVDHTFKLSKDRGMNNQEIKTIRKTFKKQFTKCPI